MRQLRRMWSLRKMTCHWTRIHVVLLFAASSWPLLSPNVLQPLPQGLFRPFAGWREVVEAGSSAPYADEQARWCLLVLAQGFPSSFPQSRSLVSKQCWLSLRAHQALQHHAPRQSNVVGALRQHRWRPSSWFGFLEDVPGGVWLWGSRSLWWGSLGTERRYALLVVFLPDRTSECETWVLAGLSSPCPELRPCSTQASHSDRWWDGAEWKIQSTHTPIRTTGLLAPCHAVRPESEAAPWLFRIKESVAVFVLLNPEAFFGEVWVKCLIRLMRLGSA